MSQLTKIEQLTGRQKAAIVLMSVNPDTAAKVFQKLEMSEVETIATEISNMKDVNQDVIDSVIEEFYQLMNASNYLMEGGFGYAQSLLEKTYGIEKAKELTDKIKMFSNIKSFSLLIF